MAQTSTSLIVIDNAPIWALAFARLEKVRFNIDLLEDRLAAFSTEQEHFDAWSEATFKNRREEIADLYERLRHLESLHRWALKVSNTENVSFERAYQMMLEEDRAYARGDAAQRKEIENRRRERDTDRRAEEARAEREADEDKQGRVLLDMVVGMDERELRQWLQNPDFAFNILLSILRANFLDDKLTFFVRVFDATTVLVREEIAEPFESTTGRRLEDVVDEMRTRLENRDRAPEEKKESGDAEPLRRAYLRLVRVLHPDHHSDAEGAVWRAKLWNRGQDAYRRQDRTELENLLVWYHLRTRNTEALTFSDIRQNHSWLKQELKQLQRQTKALKNSPAWNFSNRSDRDITRRNLEGQFDDERSQILSKIKELEGQRNWILQVADQERARHARSEQSRGRRSRH